MILFVERYLRSGILSSPQYKMVLERDDNHLVIRFIELSRCDGKALMQQWPWLHQRAPVTFDCIACQMSNTHSDFNVGDIPSNTFAGKILSFGAFDIYLFRGRSQLK